ncbi:tyrosine-type recombinase/integrase [Paenibacillus antibioticophila]|uniref:tyrosine-type recombinase/integrase n=1 Tax=Paenibacillus antibioticophila TaxID=1274374 RepID=UPI0005CAD332|nr:tyrosine-type recombinase/integrase [Paenibacillus antibioticophila]
MIDTSDLQKTFNDLVNFNEENVKIKVVIELFNRLGFERNNFIFEHPVFHRDKRVDFIYEDENKYPVYFETKRGDKDLSNRDIVQLAGYLHIRNIEWGFLCNGQRLILINDKIQPTSQTESSLQDKIVFDINIYSKRDKSILNLITKEALLQSKITNFYRDIAQFRAIKFPLGSKSWSVYRSTLMGFFNFYSERVNKYRKLDEILIDDFEEYLRNDQMKKVNSKKSVNSEQTFNNKYSHLRSMLIELKKNGIIQSHHFDQERKTMIRILDTMNVSKSTESLSLENLNTILDFLNESDTFERDILIILLCVFLGLERSTIVSLKWSMFNSQLTQINLSDRMLCLPTRITRYLKRLYEENKRNGIKGDYLFYTRYWRKYNLLSESTVNLIFDKLQKIDEGNSKWKVYSPQFIRMNLPKILFHNGFAIEEISYLLGMDLQSLSNLITHEDIISKVKLIENNQINKHPFGEILK